ncbi:hypothetical protein [Mycoplana rhizolycopersici]|uniref:Holin n=1 Tax=Mycoplana rhizolycopersici TaxID=2746702 RepID=A0ABX2QH67_9HYPH|nr:hypothetical protein [Rhizobium rhizolycopersici]NVP55953.1 hypothetical protein [Rhizobium rhizolycopersici]
MFEKLLTPLTTATSIGVAVRYLTTIVGSVIAILAILGWLTPEQAEALTRQVPELLGAVAAVVTAAVPLYAIWTKSSSDKAAEAAKAIDKQIPDESPVVIKTPAGVPDIVVTGK